MLGIDIDLDDLRIFREVIDVVLRQRAEDGKPRADGQHDVGFGERLHGRLGTHVADGPDGQGMVSVKRVIVQIRHRHRRRQVFGNGFDDLQRIGIHHASAGDNDRILRPGQKLGGPVQLLDGTAAARVHTILRRL